MTGTLTLILGGIKSGKSRQALELARERGTGGPVGFIATAEAFDGEMKLRIQKHREEREGLFFTMEEPLHLSGAVAEGWGKSSCLVVDCLTLWVNNLLFHFEKNPEKIREEIGGFLETANQKKGNLILVSNEVGAGLVSESALARKYMDELGNLNQQVARLCDEVILMTAGISQRIKGGVHAGLDR